MVVVRSVLAMPLLLAGCYLDLTAGASQTAGGVKGYGWEIGMAGGVAWDFANTVRTSAGVDASMAQTNADDGKFGTKGFSYHGRVDLALSGDSSTGHEGTVGQTRLTLDYGRSALQNLQFTAPDNPMTFENRSLMHSFYLGIGREYDWMNTVVAHFGIGPHVTYMPNDFVGDATAVGIQVHASYWWVPVFREAHPNSGSLWDHLKDPTPITPNPERNPNPTACPDGINSQGRCI